MAKAGGFLDFGVGFGEELADFQRDQRRQRGAGCQQTVAQPAQSFAAGLHGQGMPA